jgi:hypothetical protein
MGLVGNFFTFTFRFLFVLSLLGLAAKQFITLDTKLPHVKTGLENLQRNIPSHPHVSTVFDKLNGVHFELLHGHVALLVLAALACLFKMRIRYVAMFLYVVIELALFNNYYLERTERNLTTTFMYVSLMAAVFNN